MSEHPTSCGRQRPKYSVLSTPYWLLGCALAALLFPAAARAQPEPAPSQWLNDAELTAVHFVDADRGWAVGDRGVIWNTADGGRTWNVQNSGVTCRLEAVQFLDVENGFAVGGWTQPYTHETHGVALRTRDGGKSWQNTPDLTLPGLKHVKFFDTRQGCALGEGSPLYPAGVFRSEDGGRTWSPVPKGQSIGWVTGDFRDRSSGALAGLGGSLGVIAANEVKPSRTSNIHLRQLHRLLLASNSTGWLVGDGGLVLTTDDGGWNWKSPPGSLPEVISSQFDFRALAVRGTNVWMAGAPGTCVVHSPDGGRNWRLNRTDQTTPLRGLWFIDEYRGWAVGSFGTILHTRDGGQTWRVQRTGGSRAALLGVFSEPGRLPLEMVAEQAGNAAYLTAVEIIGHYEAIPDTPRRSEFTALQRTHAAVVAAGGSAADTAWRFPLIDPAVLPTSDAIQARWDAVNGERAMETLEEHLVRRIRQWRPEVVVTEDVSPRGENALAHLTNQVTLAAVEKAADTNAYDAQISQAGLPAWRVKKVFTLLPQNKPGIVNVTPSQWAPRLGRSIAEQAEAGRSLLLRNVQIAPRNIGLSLLVDRLPQDSGKRDLMSGLGLAAGSEARRQLTDPPAGNLEMLADLAQKRHNVEQLLDRMSANATVGSGWLGQANDLTKGLPSRAAGEILSQLGRKYHELGKSRDAAEAFQLLIERHPQHPLSDAAAMWLVHYYASGEVAWRERKEKKYEVRLASTGSGAATHVNPVERAGRALGLAKQIEQTRPTVYADPALRFAVAAAAREGGPARATDRFLASFPSGGISGVWTQNSVAEQWILRPTGNVPKKVCSVITAQAKPKLDGRLDDPVWQSAKPVTLQSVSGSSAYSTAAVFAFDDGFLYFALSCRKAPGVDYSAKNSSRAPDTDLSNGDRVTLMLDIDRDYATYWQFTIDHRGSPAESCFGDITWNPEWFIAAAGDEQYWTAEVAIPLTELSPKQPQVRDVWTVGIQRVIPRVGFQSFSVPAAIDPRPEGFGLLVFE